MKILKTLTLLVGFLGASVSWAHESDYPTSGDGFLPDNDQYIGVEVKSLRGITQSSFDQVISEVETVYKPIVQQKGGNLVIRRLWSNGTVNAQAFREGRNYIVEMFGGLARHAAVTPDGVALVVCHEIGHHIGGAPKYSDQDGDWASNEGQSDYFATTKCLRKVWRGKDNTVANPDPEAQRRCQAAHSDPGEANICLRIAMAGMSSSQMFYQLGGSGRAPAFTTPDTSQVSRTQDGHPQYQCRLDTYFHGGLCPVSDSTDLSNSDARVGACNQGVESEGFRPRCWYKALQSGGGGGGNPNPNPNPGPNPNPNPPPEGIASSPLLNGQNEYSSVNPSEVITLSWDVRQFAGAAGVYIEFSRPNSGFSNPNGNQPDRSHLTGFARRGMTGSLKFTAQKELPGWGRYQIRVIPLDSRGQNPVGLFSHPSTYTIGR